MIGAYGNFFHICIFIYLFCFFVSFTFLIEGVWWCLRCDICTWLLFLPVAIHRTWLMCHQQRDKSATSAAFLCVLMLVFHNSTDSFFLWFLRSNEYEMMFEECIWWRTQSSFMENDIDARERVSLVVFFWLLYWNWNCCTNFVSTYIIYMYYSKRWWSYKGKYQQCFEN